MGLGSLILQNDSFRRTLRRVSDFAHPTAARWRDRIETAYLRGEWEDLAELVPQAMQVSATLRNPGNYLRLAQARARLRRDAEAKEALEAGLARYPWSQFLLRGAAEYAMSRDDWASALGYWQRALQASERERGSRAHVDPLPRSGIDFDWYELAWRRIAMSWDASWEEAGDKPLPVTYSCVFNVLQACGESELARSLAALAQRDYPRDAELILQILPSLSDRGDRGGGAPMLERLRSAAGPSGSELAQMLGEASSLVTDLQQLGPTRADELRVLSVRAHTVYDSVVRSGDFWDEQRIRRVTRVLAERDDWPERIATTDRLSRAAWAISRRFARGRGAAIGLDDATLARAVFHNMKHELVLKIPVDRLASEIVATSGGDPVFLRLRSLEFRYLSSYPSSRMHVLYLYDALRRLGANVQLVEFVPTTRSRIRPSAWRGPQAPTLVAVPGVGGLRPHDNALEAFPEHPSGLLVPSGIRSVRQVLHHMEQPPAVLNSGEVLSEFAYDRTTKHRTSYAVHASIHPSEDLLPSFRFRTRIGRRWNRVEARGERASSSRRGPASAEAWLSTGRLDTSDWYAWLEQAIVPYFGGMVQRTDALLAERRLTDVHIGDYLYSEPAIVAERMRARGGRVHVWPHSSNPVHVDYHDLQHLSSIHCVTRSGAEIWKAAAPAAEIVHEPALMISRRQDQVVWRPGEPVSLVVIGGRPVMRHLPILAIQRHEEVYREFFSGLEPLVSAGKLRAYFKPRGLTGEHEAWLEGIVGRTADWERELAHPTRLDLPNPVFVSISVGSSALLEGVARGIPGLIVRGGAQARDYLSARSGGLAALDVEGSLQLLASLSTAENWERLRLQQQRDLAEELGLPDAPSRP